MAELTKKQSGPGIGSLTGAPVLLKQGFMQQKRLMGFKKRITLVEVTLMTALQLRLGASQVTQASVNTSQSFPSSWWDQCI